MTHQEYLNQKSKILDSLSTEDRSFYKKLIDDCHFKEKNNQVAGNDKTMSAKQRGFYYGSYQTALETAIAFEDSIGLNQLAKSFARAQAKRFKFKLAI